MLAGEMYLATDPQLVAEDRRAQELLFLFNATRPNADDERRRLEDIARTGLEPRIRNLQTRAVALAEGGAVIIVRVPRSYAPPQSCWGRPSAAISAPVPARR